MRWGSNSRAAFFCVARSESTRERGAKNREKGHIDARGREDIVLAS